MYYLNDLEANSILVHQSAEAVAERCTSERLP